MEFPANLKYSKEHEWVRAEGGVAVIGITDFAQDELGDIVFVELPKLGRKLGAGDTFGVAESVKTVSDLYSPVAGEVIEINAAIDSEPELVNKAPYGGGWMIKWTIRRSSTACWPPPRTSRSPASNLAVRYIPLTPADRARALSAIGAASVDELFTGIPPSARLNRALALPGPLSEFDLAEWFERTAEENRAAAPRSLFLGAGAYVHHVPAAVDQLLLRAEFYTGYTPYQPEVSQGTLAAMYEYQTYSAALLGMEIANASMYDGASALAEAVSMAARITGRTKVVISGLVHPHWHQVAATYTRNLGLRLETIPCAKEGVTRAGAVDAETAALVIQSPNALGVVEDMKTLGEAARAAGALYVVGVAEPVSLGLLAGPGAFGADIAVAEGRSFGGALSSGGPGVGMFATLSRHARQMPGRLAGKTTDAEGKPGYTLTLATREQHIRREKATSNICSNQALMATAAAIHISLLGKQGLRELALRNLSACHYLAERISGLKGYRLAFDKPFFNEVAVATPVAPAVINRRLREAGIVGGLDLARWYPELGRAMLLCATEVHSRPAIDRMVDILQEFAQ